MNMLKDCFTSDNLVGSYSLLGGNQYMIMLVEGTYLLQSAFF